MICVEKYNILRIISAKSISLNQNNNYLGSLLNDNYQEYAVSRFCLLNFVKLYRALLPTFVY